MSKAVIVMDMPKSCMDCKLKSRLSMSLENVTHCCNLAEGMINLKDGWDKRLDNCPLAELPERKNVDSFKTVYKRATILGYNACIDELIRGSSRKEG